MSIIIYLIFFGIPIGALIWFIVSLILFFRTDKSNAKLRKKRLILLIISAVTAGVLVLSVASIMIMLMFAISHM
mgnify:FL=1